MQRANHDRILCLLPAAALLAVCLITGSADAADSQDFELQGEYTGRMLTKSGNIRVGVQVIALGDGKFRAVGFHGGLPGDGWDQSEKEEVEGELQNGELRFPGSYGTAIIQDGKLTLYDTQDEQIGRLWHVVRESPTLGQKPPADAVVLFDGSSAENFASGKISDDGLLTPGTHSEQTFGDHSLHIEFYLPFQPKKRGQGRSNSGIYVQGRYEVQMLDSFGLAGKHNECGGIYSVSDPAVNMCLPPGGWQTYDIDFTAAEYDSDGKLTANPRITVKHNGVLIHDDLELPGERSTTAAKMKPGPEPGPIYLQDHGSQVRYRNIWVVE